MRLYDLTLYDIINRNARLYPDQTAWLDADDNQALTFGQYLEAVDRMAAGLVAAGVSKSDRIAVIGKNCLAYCVLYGAAAALGAIVVPVNWRLSAAEMTYVIHDSGPSMVFADDQDPELITSIQASLKESVQFFNLQPSRGPYGELPPAPLPGSGRPPVDVATDDGLVIIYTAAVAGRPRGALLSHGNLLCASIQVMYLLGLSSADVHLNPLPLFHIAGLCMAFSAFHAGALNVTMSKFDAAQAARLIAEHRVSLMFTFSPILQHLLAQVGQGGDDISSLRVVLGIDTPETIESYQTATGGSFFALFGQTETTMLATMSRYDERPKSAGRPIPLVDIQLMDDNDQPVPNGQSGEIAVRGPMVFKGYWGLAADNAHTFRNGWHHTGDLGRFDDDGFLWYAGRKPEKELIKPGGENVYPVEVETAILEHPAVASVVVFGVPDPKWKEGIKAVCTLKPDQSVSEKELIAFVGGRIARYKKPQYIEFVAALPRNKGVIDREAVKARYGGTQTRSV
jgi:acyl-CoA synthetase (AMP-forming)/AMP-acid ligase II